MECIFITFYVKVGWITVLYFDMPPAMFAQLYRFQIVGRILCEVSLMLPLSILACSPCWLAFHLCCVVFFFFWEGSIYIVPTVS